MKSLGLHVCTGSSAATAIAAIIASYARAVALRPLRLRDAADSAEGSRSCGVEWKGIEVCFGCLEVGLAGDTIFVGGGHQRTDGQLGQCHSSDECCVGERVSRSDPAKEDQK